MSIKGKIIMKYKKLYIKNFVNLKNVILILVKELLLYLELTVLENQVYCQ